MKELLCEKKCGEVMLHWWLTGPDAKALPAVQETLVPSLGWKDSLEKGMATRFSIRVENSTDRGS